MHGVALLAFILVRALLAMRSGKPFSLGQIRPGVLGFLLRSMFAIGAVAIWLNHGGAAWAVGFAVLAFWELTLEWLVIPCGVPYVAYGVTRLAYGFGGKHEAALNELRTRVSWGLLLGRERLERYTDTLFSVYQDRTVRGAAVAVRAVADALGGHTAGARQLFALGQELYWQHSARSTRAYCQAWLLADAASRGQYHEVVRVASRGPYTRRRVLMRAAALRLLGRADAPNPALLVLYWALAPARRHTFSLVRRALATPAREQLTPAGAGLGAARELSVKLAALPRGAPTRGELRAAAACFQQALDRGELATLLRARAAAESTLDSERVSERFSVAVVELFAELWRHTLPDRDDEPDPPMIVAAKDQLQFELLGELETLCAALPRSDAPASGDFEAHWRSWAEVRELARQFFDLLPERKSLVFEAVGGILLNHGAWLYNKDNARMLANDVFRWTYALAPPDDVNYKTLKSNVRISASA